jgi:hypothetical protein
MGVRQYSWSGTAWVEVGSAVGFQDGTTAQKGLVQLSDTYTSSDSTKAATQTAAYNAYLNNNKVTYATSAPSSPRAGDIWIDSDDTSVANPSVFAIASKTSSYTLATDLSDIYDRLIEMNVASANTVTIQQDSALTTPYPIGCQIRILQVGAGKTQIVAGTGVTLNSTPGSYLRAQWSFATIIKRSANTWVAIGDLSAS